jgi:hypothetical protein
MARAGRPAAALGLKRPRPRGSGADAALQPVPFRP